MSIVLEFNQFQPIIGDKKLLSPLSFSAREGEFIILTAPSGAGKTRLFEIISDRAQGHEGHFKIQSSTAIIPQSLDLVRQSSALDNVLTGALSRYSSLRTLLGFPRHEQKQAKDYLKNFGFIHFEKSVFELSGGEQQRIAMARLLMTTSKLWLVDEPVSHLDDQAALQCLMYLKKVAKERNITVLCVLHQNQLIDALGDRHLHWDQQWTIK